MLYEQISLNLSNAKFKPFFSTHTATTALCPLIGSWVHQNDCVEMWQMPRLVSNLRNKRGKVDPFFISKRLPVISDTRGDARAHTSNRLALHLSFLSHPPSLFPSLSFSPSFSLFSPPPPLSLFSPLISPSFSVYVSIIKTDCE